MPFGVPCQGCDRTMNPDKRAQLLKELKAATARMSMAALRYELIEANRKSYGHQGTPLQAVYDTRFNFLLQTYNKRVRKENLGTGKEVA